MQVISSMKIGASDKNGGKDICIFLSRGVHALLGFNHGRHNADCGMLSWTHPNQSHSLDISACGAQAV